MDAVKDHTPDSLGEVTEGNPFGAAVVGFGIGMLAAELGRTGKEAVDHSSPKRNRRSRTSRSRPGTPSSP